MDVTVMIALRKLFRVQRNNLCTFTVSGVKSQKILKKEF